MTEPPTSPPTSPLAEPYDPRALSPSDVDALVQIRADYTWHGDAWSRDRINFLLNLVARIRPDREPR